MFLKGSVACRFAGRSLNQTAAGLTPVPPMPSTMIDMTSPLMVTSSPCCTRFFPETPLTVDLPQKPRLFRDLQRQRNETQSRRRSGTLSEPSSRVWSRLVDVGSREQGLTGVRSFLVPSRHNTAVRLLHLSATQTAKDWAMDENGRALTSPMQPRMVMARMMGIGDSQAWGTIHGGLLMQLMEQSGVIFSTRYCQSYAPDGWYEDGMTTVSACLENGKFIAPMFTGEVAEFYAQLGYTSPHSIQVIINVYANNLEQSKKRLTNQAKFWFVPLNRTTGKALPVPQFSDCAARGEEAAILEKGRTFYSSMKQLKAHLVRSRELSTLNGQPLPTWLGATDPGNEDRTVKSSVMQMITQVHPSSCWPGETYCRGGVVLKMLDDSGCIAGTHHCKAYCVTVSFDSAFFLRKIPLGSLVIVRTHLLFASSRSVEVKVEADVQYSAQTGTGPLRERAVEAVLTCIPIDENFLPKEVPALNLRTDHERQIFEERRLAYEERKRLAAEKKQSEARKTSIAA